MLPHNKTSHDFFQRLIKQSQSFETSHATVKITAYYQNDINHGMQKSNPQSKQAPFCTTFYGAAQKSVLGQQLPQILPPSN
jgi:hypothetical protein